MIKELEKIVNINSVMLLKVDGNNIVLQVYQDDVTLPYKGTDELQPIGDVFTEYKGKRNCIINSDVYGIENQLVKIKNLEPYNAKRIYTSLLESCIPYLAKISKDEGEHVLIQASYSSDNPSLTVMAGLVDDIQVLLLDIHYQRNERRIAC